MAYTNIRHGISLAAILLTVCFITNAGEVVRVGAGAYHLGIPSGQRGPTNNTGASVTPKVSANFTQLPTTNNWWSSLIWQHDPTNAWSQNMFADPLNLRARDTGLRIGYQPNAGVTGEIPTGNGYNAKEYHHYARYDFVVGIDGLNAPQTVVDSYSDWSVTALWQTGARTLRATFGHGMPYVYFNVSGGDAVITTISTPAVWFNQNGVLGITINGNHYGVFAPTGAQWTISGTTLRSTLAGKNYLSVAVLPNNQPSTLETYRKHAYAFVTNTRVSWSFDEANSELITDYHADLTLQEEGHGNENSTIFALYRHQWLNMPGAQFEPYTFNNARGQMRVLHGATGFTTRMKFNGLLPELPLVAENDEDTFNRTQLYNYVDEIFRQPVSQVFAAPDTYFLGKAFGRVSRIIFIADQVGHIQARDHFLSQLKTRLQAWFDGTMPSVFAYDNVWKTLIGYPASFGSATELNDHHFHYGYFLMAAATVAHYDKAWADNSQWGGIIELIIKDVCNWTRNDNLFPFMRCFDPYAGHGWANGPALFAAGNNQESSSESMNFSTALILWGMATQNKTLRDLGIFLYTTETRAIEEYWFDVHDQTFPVAFDRPALGMLWGDGGAYALFFAAPVEGVHGINFLPITSGSLYLGRHPSYLEFNQNGMAALSPRRDFWRDIHMSVIALYNPQQAIQEFNGGYTPEGGESRAHTYHWIHNLNKLGRLDTEVTANYPGAVVFNKNGQKRYVAYNHENNPITITFSDNTQLTVQPNSFGIKGLGAQDTPTPPDDNTTPPDDNQTPPDDNQTPPDDNNAERTIIIESLEAPNGIFNFNLIANGPIAQATLHYSINNQAATSINMQSSNNQSWQAALNNVQRNALVEAHFTYVVGAEQFTTNTFRYVYGGSCQECPPCPECPNDNTNPVGFDVHANCQLACTCIPNDQGQLICACDAVCTPTSNNQPTEPEPTPPTPPANPEPTNPSPTIVDEGAYVREITLTSPTTATIRFTPKATTNWVDLHYTINTRVPQNVRMTQDNGSWLLTISSFSVNDQISFNFTYQQGTVATTTPVVTYTRS